MKTLLVLFAMIAMPLVAFSDEFGVYGGLGSGSLYNTGLDKSEGKFETGLAWNLGVSYDIEANKNYLKLGVIHQAAELTVYGAGRSATADVDMWSYELSGNYYLAELSEKLNLYGVIDVGFEYLKTVGQKTDGKYYIGFGGNLRYKVSDKAYLSAVLEYKKVINDFEVLYPSLNVEFKL